jgi:hypothetical protein
MRMGEDVIWSTGTTGAIPGWRGGFLGASGVGGGNSAVWFGGVCGGAS